MDQLFLFETTRCGVRFLQMNDLEPFHEMQNNPKVMQYVRGESMTRDQNEQELTELIEKYHREDNNFWIYAIERKTDGKFIGTCALIKDDNNSDELGYRFLEKYWGLGYGSEICAGLVYYAKQLALPSLVGYVVEKNIASAKILEKCDFQIVSRSYDEKLKMPELKYKIRL